MKKRGRKTAKKEVKAFFREEEEALFSLMDLSIRKKHIFSLASTVFSLAIGLGMISSIHKQGKVLNGGFAVVAFIVALIVVKGMVIKRLREENRPLSAGNISKPTLALYLNTLILTFVFVFALWLIKREVLLPREVMFLWSLAVAFASVTFHMR